MQTIDVHQHLWPPGFVEELRRRAGPPRLIGWTLKTDGEPDYEVRPGDHDVARRAALARADDVDLALVSLSSPLNIEWMPGGEAAPLLAAYHEGSLALPTPFGSWAAASLTRVEPTLLGSHLERGCVGLQLPATALLDGRGYEHCGPLLDCLEALGHPLLIHPGSSVGARSAPPWWPALVPYVQQMHQAWFAFRAYGRPRHKSLRVCFAMLAGLAPLHAERMSARGGGERGCDHDVFLEISSYGPHTIAATAQVVGLDALVNGSDRPYGMPGDAGLGAAGASQLRGSNAFRLLHGEEVQRDLGVAAYPHPRPVRVTASRR